jgi:hypothetical protein
VGTETFHGDRQTDITKLTIAFHNFAKHIKTISNFYTQGCGEKNILIFKIYEGACDTKFNYLHTPEDVRIMSKHTGLSILNATLSVQNVLRPYVTVFDPNTTVNMTLRNVYFVTEENGEE